MQSATDGSCHRTSIYHTYMKSIHPVHNNEHCQFSQPDIVMVSRESAAIDKCCLAGDDKKVAVWDAWAWKERSQAKLFAKGSADALASSMRAGAATGSEHSILVISGERAAVWGL